MIAGMRRPRPIGPRSVLMTADTVGGVWTFAVELAGALSSSGVQVTLATMGGWTTCDQRAELRRLRDVEVFESRFRLEWMESPWEDIQRAGDWLLRLANRIMPDVVHLNGYVHGDMDWPAPVVMTGHSCVLSWWKAVRGGVAPEQWNRYRSEVRSGLEGAAIVTAPSKGMLAALNEQYGPLKNSIVIPNGRDWRRFAPGQKGPYILTAGRIWDEAKNIAALDAVASRLPWPVYIAGESAHPNGNQFQKSSAHLLGRLAPAELASWYARACIYAHPARYEPFGLAILEAALSGCALVLGDVPSLRENWDEAALFVDPNDSHALESAIRTLIRDAHLRSMVAGKACARALTFAPERMRDAYLAAYRSVMREEEVRSCA